MQSLRSRLVITILICWVVPIVIIVAVAGFLLRSNYDNEMTRRLETDANYTLQQLEAHLERAFADSKAVSYDGVIRSAYRSWQQDGDKAALYRSTNDYLAQNFGREHLPLCNEQRHQRIQPSQKLPSQYRTDHSGGHARRRHGNPFFCRGRRSVYRPQSAGQPVSALRDRCAACGRPDAV